MPHYYLHHRHDPEECAAAFAAWRGFDSPLRRRPVATTCLSGGHRLFWRVEAADRSAASSLLPPFVAARTEIVEVRDVEVP
jgi:hypothetical protein